MYYRGDKRLKPTEVTVLGIENNNYFKKEVAEFYASELEIYFEENNISDTDKILVINQLIEEFR
ncbi:MAG: hypothetical protein IKE41_04335 [Clostridia bacterium]|nr:hypothetical protein [Clostridia bacterium]